MFEAEERKADEVIKAYESYMSQYETLSKRIKGASINLLNWERAEQAITLAAKATHDAIALDLSSICSQAVNEVTGKSCYELKIYTKEKRNSIELCIDLYKNGKLEGNPVDSNGGGICDILSVTLLFVCWKLSGNPTRDLFVLDEPFKNLSADYQERACHFFQELANSMEVKVLMSTHISDFVEIAEHKIAVERKRGASCIVTTE
jgi:DNA repair exonuclease SbcCD ATPase subunit